MKVIISIGYKCKYEDIEVRFIDSELSDIDVTTDGMFDWMDCEARIISGVRLPFEIGSDEHLDAINSGLLETYLEFN